MTHVGPLLETLLSAVPIVFTLLLTRLGLALLRDALLSQRELHREIATLREHVARLEVITARAKSGNPYRSMP